MTSTTEETKGMLREILSAVEAKKREEDRATTLATKPIISDEVRTYALEQARQQGIKEAEELIRQVDKEMVRELRGTFDPIKQKWVSKYDPPGDNL
jgi:hypothetical protein